MIPVVRVKDGVQFTVIAPAGFRILSALQQTCRDIGHDITITSACDGAHSGVGDPHHDGKAYDVRSKDLPKDKALAALMKNLQEGPEDVPAVKDGGYVTQSFFAWIEKRDTDDEHIHVQQRKNTVYPPLMVTNYEEVQQATAGE